MEASGGGEGAAVSSSCSSLSGQEVVTVTTEARAPSKRTPMATGSTAVSSPSQGHSTTTGTSSSFVPPGRSKAGEKASRTGKEASLFRLEDELRKLRHERQSMLVTESELRSQLAQLTTLERTSRTETNQARQEVEHLLTKVANLTQRLEVNYSLFCCLSINALGSKSMVYNFLTS